MNSNKALQTYAYLTAYLRTDATVADVYDCLLPFLVDSIAKRPDKPVSVDRIARDLKSIGLEIPLYALQQLLPRLVNRGIIEWNAVSHSHLPTANIKSQSTQFAELPESFAQVEPRLASYAKELGIAEPLVGENWSDALISFLKSNYAGKTIKTAEYKSVMVANGPERQEFVIGSFLAKLAANEPVIFEHVIRIYTGVQIEDFITNIQTLQRQVDFKDLIVFYDTAILLRLLGTSGDLHKDATIEMHHSLQSLGAKTYFFGSTSTEVENILSTVSGAYERGHEIYHETSDALLNGEISIGQIRDFTATYEARLAKLNIFPFHYNFQARKSEDYYQIDENAFAEALKSGALVADRRYSAQNAYNDAHALALILRMRKGGAAKDIGRSKAIFITKNRLLQRVSRRFAIEHTDVYDDSSIPPAFTDGQITMASWLGSGKGLSSSKVTKELLARCYSAVQPSSEWVDAFADALAEFQEEAAEDVSDRANAIIFLRTARNAARDASLNDPSVLKRLNIAELFRQAEQSAQAEERARERQVIEQTVRHSEELSQLGEAHLQQIEIVRKHLDEEYQASLDHEVRKARQDALYEEEVRRNDAREGKALMIAGWLVAIIYILIVSVCGWVLLFGLDYQSESPILKYLITFVACAITTLALLDLGGYNLVRTAVNSLRIKLARGLVNLVSRFGD